MRVVYYLELFRLYRHIYCVKSQGFFLCCSRKVAKTDLYNERKGEGRKEEGEIEKGACSAWAGSVLSAAFLYIHALISDR